MEEKKPANKPSFEEQQEGLHKFIEEWVEEHEESFANEYLEDANFDYWLKSDLWQLQEGISLLLGIEPIQTLFIYRHKEEWKAKKFWKRFDEIAQLAERSIKAEILKPANFMSHFLCDELKPSIFLKWANSKGFTIPSCCISLISEQDEQIYMTNEENTSKKLRPNQKDKIACQAIARTLWDLEPKMTIADMIKHRAIQIFGNGAQYTDKILRGWLSKVDPRSLEEKTGRPSKK